MRSSTSSPPEEQVLLPGASIGRGQRQTRKALLPKFNSWVAHPFWLIPIVLIVSTSRGVTMSPRIQVYKAIACRVLNQESETPGLQYITSAVDCKGPEVQARAAKIQASVVTLMSVLSAISTGFWSRVGDNYGRKPVLAMFVLGALFMEYFYVLVMNPQSIFGQHPEFFILTGPILEGFVGGLSSFNGVVHAYTADCTRPGSRSKIFSTIQGMVFVGLAFGPWFSGFVLPKSAVLDEFFYVSISLLAVTFIYLVFLCPESRVPPSRTSNVSTRDSATFKMSPLLVTRRRLQHFISALMIPIAMFSPRIIPGSNKKNYNLTFVGLGLFLYIVSTGVYTNKYLYAQHIYEWTASELGHYMSLLWITKAVNLLVFLPLIIPYLKSKSSPSEGAVTSESLSAEMRFDQNLARCSMAVDGIADALVALTPTSSQPTFIALSCLSSFTSGSNPALHSLSAVCLHACGRGSELGALFGGISVVSAISHVIAPYIYALTYASTVAYFPKSIFCLAAALLGTGVLLLSTINTAPENITLGDYTALEDDLDEEE